jgi:hypothetical protein
MNLTQSSFQTKQKLLGAFLISSECDHNGVLKRLHANACARKQGENDIMQYHLSIWLHRNSLTTHDGTQFRNHDITAVLPIGRCNKTLLHVHLNDELQQNVIRPKHHDFIAVRYSPLILKHFARGIQGSKMWRRCGVCVEQRANIGPLTAIQTAVRRLCTRGEWISRSKPSECSTAPVIPPAPHPLFSSIVKVFC